MTALVPVALGGALGAVARYGIGGWIASAWSDTSPWGTLFVNTLGSFLLGGFLIAQEVAPWSPDVRRFVAVGILGAFTTFSTFSYEALALMQGGQWTRAGAYVLGSVGLGLLAVLGGMALVQGLLVGRS